MQLRELLKKHGKNYKKISEEMKPLGKRTEYAIMIKSANMLCRMRKGSLFLDEELFNILSKKNKAGRKSAVNEKETTAPQAKIYSSTDDEEDEDLNEEE